MIIGVKNLKGNAWVSSTRKLYCVIGLLIIGCIFALCYFIHINSLHTVRRRVDKELLSIAILLETELKGSFEELLQKNSPNIDQLSQQEKVLELNREVQPIIDKLSRSFTGYGIGYYSIELDSIVAIGPNYAQSLLKPVSRDLPYFKCYESGKAEFVSSNVSISWFGKPIRAVTYPIVRNGQIIGHTWANVQTKDVYARVKSITVPIFIISLILLSFTLLLMKAVIDFFAYQ